MVVTQMLAQHRILTQVAGHGMDVLKILPPLMIGEREVDMFVNALDSRADRVPEVSRSDVGDRQQFRSPGVAFEAFGVT